MLSILNIRARCIGVGKEDVIMSTSLKHRNAPALVSRTTNSLTFTRKGDWNMVDVLVNGPFFRGCLW